MIRELFAQYQFGAKHTANITAGNVTIRQSVPQIQNCSVDLHFTTDQPMFLEHFVNEIVSCVFDNLAPVMGVLRCN